MEEDPHGLDQQGFVPPADLVYIVATALAELALFKDRIRKTLEQHQDEIAGAVKAFHEHSVEALRGVQTIVRDLPDHMRRSLTVLAANGWYADGDFGAGAIGELARTLNAGDLDSVDTQLIDDYRQRLPTVKAVLFERYPLRAKLLAAAFAAHERGEYELSVPAFLTHADGICHDVTRKMLFTRNKTTRAPEVGQYAENFAADAFSYAVFSPLTAIHPIAASERERPAGFRGLNRHQVLHGISLDYGTELNGFKAISLLSYLAWVLHLEADGPRWPGSAEIRQP